MMRRRRTEATPRKKKRILTGRVKMKKKKQISSMPSLMEDARQLFSTAQPSALRIIKGP